MHCKTRYELGSEELAVACEVRVLAGAPSRVTMASTRRAGFALSPVVLIASPHSLFAPLQDLAKSYNVAGMHFLKNGENALALATPKLASPRSPPSASSSCPSPRTAPLKTYSLAAHLRHSL